MIGAGLQIPICIGITDHCPECTNRCNIQGIRHSRVSIAGGYFYRAYCVFRSVSAAPPVILRNNIRCLLAFHIVGYCSSGIINEVVIADGDRTIAAIAMSSTATIKDVTFDKEILLSVATNAFLEIISANGDAGRWIKV